MSLAAVLEEPAPPAASFHLYRWDRFPSVLIFDTADFATQNRMFSRLAFFLEKRGSRGRLLSNDELAGSHGWNAHDYGPQGLAAFFEKARREAFPLNLEERLLLDIVLRQGIVAVSRGAYRPGVGALISISRSSSVYERRFLLLHESFHGIFFVSAEYRRFCFALWDSLLEDERGFFSALLALLGYDSADPALCVNEMQAYLMQQPVRLVPGYFERAVSRFPDARLAPIPGPRLQGLAGDLGAFVAAHFGLEPGGTLAPRREEPQP
jgi:hypothetical protein